jgi:hypothetical protein
MKNWKEFGGSGRGLNEVLSSREGIAVPVVHARIGTQRQPDTIQKRQCLDHQFSPFLSFTGLEDTGDNNNSKATYGQCRKVVSQHCYTRSVPKVMRMIFKKKKNFIEHTCNYSFSPSK